MIRNFNMHSVSIYQLEKKQIYVVKTMWENFHSSLSLTMEEIKTEDLPPGSPAQDVTLPLANYTVPTWAKLVTSLDFSLLI